jgi:hypothetical protein
MVWERTLWLLAQVDANQSLSTNLKWLSFPQATSETVTMFIFVMVAIVLTFIVTLLLNQWFQALLDKLPHRKKQKSVAIAERLEPDMRLTLDRLKPVAGIRHIEDLLTDPAKFEQAVAAYVAAAPLQENLNGIGLLRRRIGFTVMNPLTEVISTRQLLPDLTVRLVATVGDEKLDLYCPLLEATERHLLIDVPYQREIYELLRQHPDVFLLYWRESDGETAFKVKLLPLHTDHISAFRCVHALRAEDAGRTDFRLTVDLPVSYQFVDLHSVMEHRESGKEVSAIRGEGKIVDLSHGGASFLSDHALLDHGFAQLHFTVGDQPVRVMLEVLNQSPAGDGKTLVRGKFRGLSPELAGFLNGFLTREQFKRIQQHPNILVDTRTIHEPASPTTPVTARAAGTAAILGAGATGTQAAPFATRPESSPRPRTPPKPPSGSHS